MLAIETKANQLATGWAIKATCTAHSVTIPHPTGLTGMDAHAEAAKALAREMGWTGALVGGIHNKGCVFLHLPQEPDGYGIYKIG